MTIDDDLGRSASGTVARPNFDAFVAQLCQGVVSEVCESVGLPNSNSFTDR